MNTYRENLPQLGEGIFFTDGGLETTLIFQNGYDLPCFAAFSLLRDERGVETLKDYYRTYVDIAVESNSGFLLESPTWRASRDWGEQLGYDRQSLAEANRDSISLMESIRHEYLDHGIPLVISATVGPRGDGYLANDQMTVQEAIDYHREQIEIFADTKADLITAMTLTYPEEAIGITLAAKEFGIAAAIAFTTETDGRLPNGQLLGEAIEQVDSATDNGPAYYMINCAHTDHFSHAIADDEEWAQRIRGVRANASRCSHTELDEAEELDDGDPQEFGELYRKLRLRFPKLSVLGGCCGTDHRHVQAVQRAC